MRKGEGAHSDKGRDRGESVKVKVLVLIVEKINKQNGNLRTKKDEAKTLDSKD